MDIQQHTFAVEVSWSDPAGTADPRGYTREHAVRAVLGPRDVERGLRAPEPLTGSAARAFHGDAEQWNPEQLLLASLAQCHALSYLHAAAEASLVVTALTVTGSAELRMEPDGGGRVTGAVLRPAVELADASRRAEADALHAVAAERCVIARSVDFPVTHEPVTPASQAARRPAASTTETGTASGSASSTADDQQLPTFSRRLGAPIATLAPVGKPPSQVTGLPARGQDEEARRRGAEHDQQTRQDGAPMTDDDRRDDAQEAEAVPGTTGGSGSSGASGSSGSSGSPGSSADLGYLPPPGGGSGPQPIRPAAPSRSAEPASGATPGGEQQSFYEAVGGHETFARIVEVFYEQVAEDPDFRALYPEEDLEPAKRRLLMFLEQYWGGPRTYQEERGHPRLRMRHMPFQVDAWARDTWLRYMRRAVDAVELSPLHDEILWDYLSRAAHSMVNS